MFPVKADKKDIPGLLALQKLAYQSEARLVNDYSIQPLTQTLEEAEKEFEEGLILKLIDRVEERIIGSVRAKEEDRTVFIGKLMLHPDYQNRGYGAKLLSAIEAFYPGRRAELFTSTLSRKNISLYQKNGYSPFKECGRFLFLEKNL